MECPNDVGWVIEKVWISLGRNGEQFGTYYAQGEGNSRSYLIGLYKMTFGGIPQPRDRLRKMRGFNVCFGWNAMSRMGAILDLDR